MGDSFTANMSNWEEIEPTFTQIVKEKLPGSEGPVFDRNGKFFMVAPEVMEGENFAGQVVTVDLETGKSTVVCSPKDGDIGGIPAGCQCDLDNNIWIADMRLGILKMDQNGKYQQMFKTDRDNKTLQGCNDCIFDYDGNLWVTAPAGNIAPAAFSRSWDMFKTDRDNKTLQGCNDCIFDYDGNLWVTAPAGNIAPAKYARSSEEPFGAVYCVTKDKELVRIDDKYLFSNGLAVLHNKEGKPSKLIVAETRKQTLWQYDILGPGKVAKKTLFGKLPSNYERCGPDGMDFDEEDFLIVANHGGEHLEVFSPQGGDPVARIKCPFKTPSNVHFKPGTNEVYVTEHDTHALWKFEWERKGKPQYCETK